MGTQTQPGNKHSTQNILNWSFDPDFNLLAISLIGYDGSVMRRIKVDSNGNLIIGESALPTGAATSDKQDTQTTLLQGIAGMIPSVYDYISLTYTDTNLTGVVFKTGGLGGTTVSTLTLGYDGSNNLTEVTKT